MAHFSRSPPPDVFRKCYRHPNRFTVGSLDEIVVPSVSGTSNFLTVPGATRDSETSRSPPPSPAKSPFKKIQATDVISVMRGWFKPSPKLKMTWKMSWSEWSRSILASPDALQQIGKIIYRLHALPRKEEFITPYKIVVVKEVKSLEMLLPVVGLENINIGSNEIITLFSKASRETKMKFLDTIVDYLIEMGESGPDLSDVETTPLHDIMQIKETDYPAGETSIETTESFDVNSKEVLKFIWIILRVDKIRYIILRRIVNGFQKYYTDRNILPDFTEEHMNRMRLKFGELYFALRSFLKPVFDRYPLEEYRKVLEKTTNATNQGYFHAAVYNHYSGQLLEAPITNSLVALDHKFCISWGVMFLRMCEEIPDDSDLLCKGIMEECIVCMDTFDDKQMAVLDICDHFFCPACIKTIVSKTTTALPVCPQCRRSFETWTTKSRYNDIRKSLKEAGALKGKMKFLDTHRDTRRSRRGGEK